MQLTDDEMKRGIITASAGDHAQAVAIAAEKRNLVAKIIVPKNTPKVKIEQIKEHKVELVLYGDTYDEAEQFAIGLAKKDGLTYISAYDDKLIVAGLLIYFIAKAYRSRQGLDLSLAFQEIPPI